MPWSKDTVQSGSWGEKIPLKLNLRYSELEDETYESLGNIVYKNYESAWFKESAAGPETWV